MQNRDAPELCRPIPKRVCTSQSCSTLQVQVAQVRRGGVRGAGGAGEHASRVGARTVEDDAEEGRASLKAASLASHIHVVKVLLEPVHTCAVAARRDQM